VAAKHKHVLEVEARGIRLEGGSARGNAQLVIRLTCAC
jgi:hypothetical protein